MRRHAPHSGKRSAPIPPLPRALREWRASLPKNDRGKIARKELKDELARRKVAR